MELKYVILKQGDIAGQIGRVLDLKSALVLNSRQGKRPSGGDEWVRQTARALDELIRRGYTILSSLEMKTYEFAVWYAGSHGGRLAVFVPVYGGEDAREETLRCMTGFGLDPRRTVFFPYVTDIPRQRHKDLWPERDAALIGTADLIAPVSVRPEGNLETLLAGAPPEKILREFAIEYRQGHPVKQAEFPETPGKSLPGWDCLTHWTSSAHGPFPGETPAEYYESVFHDTAGYSHSALHALARIIGTGVIYAGSDGIRGGNRAVSFTADDPFESLGRMFWRFRRQRYTFEPYGIAFDREWMAANGARPVVYGADEDYDELDERDRPYFQSSGRDNRWEGEREWRYAGDLRLRDIPADKVRLIVPSRTDAELLREHAGDIPFDVIFLSE
ncbi:MAG: hypothetical protein HPY53_16960 [Brevinematales bacterium]|nr:hypothetical protein [Brevinematales bacterium]